MLLEADKIYQGTSQIYLGTGPGRPWCRYATSVLLYFVKSKSGTKCKNYSNKVVTLLNILVE